jgi:hypothetical protein
MASGSAEGLRLSVGRAGAAGALGVALGWVLSLDLDWSNAASRHECTGQSGVCFGLAVPAGLVAAVAAVVAACWIGFAAMNVRPLRITVPAGLLSELLVTVIYLQNVTGGRLHPAWLFAMVNGALFALLAALAALWIRH